MKNVRIMYVSALMGVMVLGMGVTGQAGTAPDEAINLTGGDEAINQTINLALPTSGVGYEWPQNALENVVRITADGSYRITGAAKAADVVLGSTTNPSARVEVVKGVSATITLANCTISCAVASPLTLESDASTGAKVTLRLEGDNMLQCLMTNGKLCPGLQVEGKSELTISAAETAKTTAVSVSEGTLTVLGACLDDSDVEIEGNEEGDLGAAGIGGRVGETNGKIIINSGNLDVQGGYMGAGIGSGKSASGGETIINGGLLKVVGGPGAAAIGGGYDGNNGGKITITGGEIDALGGYAAACIGGGWGGINSSGANGNGGVITITGGTINADNSRKIFYNGAFIDNYGAASIGGGAAGDGGDITIAGGQITAVGSKRSAAIGGGTFGNGGNIKILGGKVIATGGNDNGQGGPAAIGGGDQNRYSGNITISGGVVVANTTGEGSPAAIGCGARQGVAQTITISGGTVYAASETGPGIGSHAGDNSGNITISGGAVIADEIGVGASGKTPTTISGKNTIVLSQSINATTFGGATVLTTDNNIKVNYPILLPDTATDVILKNPLTIPDGGEIFVPGEYQTIGGVPIWQSGLKIIGTSNLGTGSVIVNYLRKDTIHYDTIHFNILDTLYSDTIIYDDTTHLHDTLRTYDTIYLDTTYLHDTFYISTDTFERIDTITTHVVFTIYDTTHVPIAQVYDTIARDTVFIDTAYLVDTIRHDSIIYNYIHRDTIDYTLVPDTRLVVFHDTISIEIFQHDTTYIVIDRTTATQHTLLEEIRATSYDEGVYLEGLVPGKRFSIFTISGAKYFNGIATSTGTFGLADIADGLYILYQEGKYTKFQHKKP